MKILADIEAFEFLKVSMYFGSMKRRVTIYFDRETSYSYETDMKITEGTHLGNSVQMITCNGTSVLIRLSNDSVIQYSGFNYRYEHFKSK